MLSFLPNLLSISRVICLPFLFRSMNQQGFWFWWLFIIFSDFADGWLARRNGWVTDLGKVLDPLADKILFFSLFLFFWQNNRVSGKFFLFFLAKDLLLILGSLILLYFKKSVEASFWGKFAAFLQIFLITLVVYQKRSFSYFEEIQMVLANLLSFFSYLRFK